MLLYITLAVYRTSSECGIILVTSVLLLCVVCWQTCRGTPHRLATSRRMEAVMAVVA